MRLRVRACERACVRALLVHRRSPPKIKRDPLCELALMWEITLTPRV